MIRVMRVFPSHVILSAISSVNGRPVTRVATQWFVFMCMSCVPYVAASLMLECGISASIFISSIVRGFPSFVLSGYRNVSCMPCSAWNLVLMRSISLLIVGVDRSDPDCIWSLIFDVVSSAVVYACVFRVVVGLMRSGVVISGGRALHNHQGVGEVNLSEHQGCWSARQGLR